MKGIDSFKKLINDNVPTLGSFSKGEKFEEFNLGAASTKQKILKSGSIAVWLGASVLTGGTVPVAMAFGAVLGTALGKALANAKEAKTEASSKPQSQQFQSIKKEMENLKNEFGAMPMEVFEKNKGIIQTKFDKSLSHESKIALIKDSKELKGEYKEVKAQLDQKIKDLKDFKSEISQTFDRLIEENDNSPGEMSSYGMKEFIYKADTNTTYKEIIKSDPILKGKYDRMKSADKINDTRETEKSNASTNELETSTKAFDDALSHLIKKYSDVENNIGFSIASYTKDDLKFSAKGMSSLLNEMEEKNSEVLSSDKNTDLKKKFTDFGEKINLELAQEEEPTFEIQEEPSFLPNDHTEVSSDADNESFEEVSSNVSSPSQNDFSVTEPKSGPQVLPEINEEAKPTRKETMRSLLSKLAGTKSPEEIKNAETLQKREKTVNDSLTYLKDQLKTQTDSFVLIQATFNVMSKNKDYNDVIMNNSHLRKEFEKITDDYNKIKK